MHKFYEAAHKNALTLPPLYTSSFPFCHILANSRGAHLLFPQQQLTMFTVTTVCRRCLMPKLMTIILSAASALSDAALAKDALFMMKRRCSRNNHRVAVAIPSLPLLPQTPHTPQQHYSWVVLQRGVGGGGGAAAGGNDYERQHILCFNAVEIGQQQQQQ